MHGLFITGTDTGAGKTVVAAAICAALTARGERVAAYKPVVTGLDEPDATWPMDHELLAACAQSTAGAVTARTFGPPLSPHRAAELAGRPLDPAVLVADARRAAAAGDVLVAEGVGGLPVVIAARPGLGTINHTLLTVQAARAAGLRVAGVAMGPWPGDPVARRESEANVRAIEALGDVAVSPVPLVARPDVADLAAAGATLPLDLWLATG